MSNNLSPTSCSRCHTPIEPQSRFCSQCGTALFPRRRFPLKALIPTLFIGGLVWYESIWSITELGGTKPTKAFQPQKESATGPSPHGKIAEQPEDPILKKLREDAQNEPSLGNLQKLGREIVIRMRSSEGPSQELALEAIDTYSRILSQEKENEEALLTLADISFDQQVFSKALTYYQQYLQKKPTDFTAKARLASTMTFLGKFDDAERILRELISRNPQDFHANAYLSIALAQKGDTTAALEIGKKAIAVAPSEEARSRFEAFLESLKSQSSDPMQSFLNSIKANPIAGRKFVRGIQEGKIIKLYFIDFPMSAMPPFAKEKFFGQLKANLRISEIEKLQFIDDPSGMVMDELAVK